MLLHTEFKNTFGLADIKKKILTRYFVDHTAASHIRGGGGDFKQDNLIEEKIW